MQLTCLALLGNVEGRQCFFPEKFNRMSPVKYRYLSRYPTVDHLTLANEKICFDQEQTQQNKGQLMDLKNQLLSTNFQFQKNNGNSVYRLKIEVKDC